MQIEAPAHVETIPPPPAQLRLPGAVRQKREIGFLARVLVQATLPHRRPEAPTYDRVCGRLRFRMQAPAEVGLPFGSLPRLVLLRLTTEAFLRRSASVRLERSPGAFLRRLGIPMIAGKRGNRQSFLEQLQRLLSTSIECRGTKALDLHWRSGATTSRGWPREVTLSQDLFEQTLRHPVPLDMTAVRALRGSPLALDIYAWLTFRMSYLRRPCPIPWAALQLQFGAAYGRPQDFKRRFRQYLARVRRCYSTVRLEVEPEHLVLLPSPPHVRRSARS